MASETSLPATKRAEVRWPKLERSAIPRRDRLSDRAMKRALSIGHRRSVGRRIGGLDCRKLSCVLVRHYSIFYHKAGGGAVTVVTTLILFAISPMIITRQHD